MTNAYAANILNQYTAITGGAASSPTYDADGNMLSCALPTGDWRFRWDIENRLIAVSNGEVQVSHAYDYRHRRIRKTAPAATHTFLYDGWNLIHETVAATNGLITEIEYFWGSDLSGTLQGSGGVGGLLAVSMNGAFFFPCYDNNGNIVAYVDESGSIRAEYVYDAFGITISQSGDMVDVFRFRFSTKYFDEESGLYYYGCRFYSPVIQRFVNRDPIGDNGGLNLYGFVGNDPLNRWDYLGMCPKGYYWSWTANMCLPDSMGSPSPQPPRLFAIPQNGFAVIGDEVEPDTRGADTLTKLGMYHVDIVHNGTVVYVGAGGGLNRWTPSGKLVNAVHPLSIRSSGRMQYGNKEIKCKCASESDVLNCLRAKPQHKGWNCQGDVQEAVNDCCLSGFRTLASSLFYWWD